MNEISCEICMDLIPLVYDGVASKGSEAAVENHIAGCSSCREVAQQGKKIPIGNEEKALSLAVNRVKKIVTAGMAAFVVMGICLCEMVMQGSSVIFIAAILLLRWLSGVASRAGSGWKHRGKQVLAFGAATLLVLGLAVGLNAINGNPVSRMLARKAAENYLAGKFPDAGYVIAEIRYDSKRGHYQAEIVKPGSLDVSFTVDADEKGNFHHDTYDDVLTGRNTAERLERQYQEQAETALLRLNLGYRATVGCGLEFEWRPYQGDMGNPQYILDGEPLVPDREYKVDDLGEQIGNIRVTVETETVSRETAADILLEIKSLMEEENVPFHSVDLTLQYPRKEPLGRREGSFTVSGFLREDIYEEGLAERLS